MTGPVLTDATEKGVARAVAQLAAGGRVGLPTETVYGLAADATNDQAVAGIFSAKGRPSFNPLIVHVPDAVAAAREVEWTEKAEHLAAVFWPGPLTLILPRRAGSAVSLLCSAGLPTLAVRAPAHPVAQAVLRGLGRPVAAPSANASGRLSPTTPQHVAEGFPDTDILILAAGRSSVGLESTVVDMTAPVPTVLRFGAVTVEDLHHQIGGIVVAVEASAEGSPRSPGQLLRHYAPKTPLRLRAVDVVRGEALLAFGSVRFMGLRGGGFASDLPAGALLNLSPTGDLTEAAGNLFALLHRLDAGGFSSIAVMDIPDIGLGQAINDRLGRAAGAQQSAP